MTVQIGAGVARAQQNEPICGGIEEPREQHSNKNQEEHNAVHSPEQNNEPSKKKEKKMKRKRSEVENQEDQSINITEAQLQFDQLYTEEVMKQFGT